MSHPNLTPRFKNVVKFTEASDALAIEIHNAPCNLEATIVDTECLVMM